MAAITSSSVLQIRHNSARIIFLRMSLNALPTRSRKLTGGFSFLQIAFNSFTVSLASIAHVHRPASRSIRTSRNVSADLSPAAAAIGAGATAARFLTRAFFGPAFAFAAFFRARLAFAGSKLATGDDADASNSSTTASSSSKSTSSPPSCTRKSSSASAFFFLGTAAMTLLGPALAGTGPLGTTPRSGVGGAAFVFFLMGDTPLELSTS